MSSREANTIKRVYILDIDGTLIPSAEIDDQCFWQAVFTCFESPQAAPDLHRFKHVTDSGILREWCSNELNRPATVVETRWIKQDFLQRLEMAYQQQADLFQPLPGVEDWLQTLAASPHACAGIATGGWGHTARLKLKLSGLDRFALPLASSDDAVERIQIMRIAAQRILNNGSTDGLLYTYIGDGVWDFQASKLLDWNFIGIASHQQAKRLRIAGATDVRSDFTANVAEGQRLPV